MKKNFDGLFLLKLMKHRIEEQSTIFGELNLNTRDRFFRNALYWAISYEQIDDVKLLLKYGVSLEVAPNLDAYTHALNVNNQEVIELFKGEPLALSA